MLELLAGEHGIHAVPFRNGRPLKPIALPSGAIVEEFTPEQERHKPHGVRAYLGIDADGKAVPYDATGFDDNSAVYIGLSGTYLLPSGQVAAVYGCRSETIEV